MDRPVVEPNVAVIVEPGKCVLEPIFIVSPWTVSPWKVFSRKCAATFLSSDRRMKADARLGKHIVKFERFGEILVEDHRTIGDAKIGAHGLDDVVELVQTLVQQRAVAEDGTVQAFSTRESRFGSDQIDRNVDVAACGL
jgi:hypothetical protein